MPLARCSIPVLSSAILFLVLAVQLENMIQCAPISSPSMEVTVLKYETASAACGNGKCSLPEDSNLSLNIGFCTCLEELPFSGTSPEDHLSQCKCQRNMMGKRGKRLLGQKCSQWTASYPQSCLSKPDFAKCLIARIYTRPTRFLYVRVGIDDRALTNPEWQSIPVGKKNTAKLATDMQSKFVTLTYAVQTPLLKGGKEEQEVAKLAELINPMKLKEIKSPKTTHLTTQLPVTAPAPVAINVPVYSTLPIATPHDLIAKMGANINSIRDFLISTGKQQRVHAFTFDVAGFKHSVIQIHNRYRWHHQAETLSVDSSCELEAKRWADSLAARRSCLSHDPVRRFGENLFFFANLDYFTDPVTMAEAAVHSFYMESSIYKYANANWRSDVYRFGHFTQMIWKTSRKIGVGVAIGRYSAGAGACLPRRDPGYFLYVVVKYDPPGNVQLPGEFLANVSPVVR